MEIDNAVNQAAKEISQRYDFRDTGASVEFANDRFMLKAVSEDRVLAVLDVLQSKLIKRGISLKSIETGDPYVSGKETRLEIALKQGIDQANAKKISKLIRDEAPQVSQIADSGRRAARQLEKPRRSTGHDPAAQGG